MNIGQLMRGLMGEAQVDQAKALELKVGQIVRGVLIQALDDQEALVQINGVQVRAKLETSLAQGQSTMLQVQPDSAKGAVVLKALEPSAAAFPEETLKELARTLGLPNQRWAMELARELKRDGFPVTKETGHALQQAMAAKPEGAGDEAWAQAAATALRRGLPMTSATVGALHQALSGKPAGELLEALRGQLAALSGGGADAPAGQAAGARGALPEAAARVMALLADGEALLRAVADGAGARAAGVPQAGLGAAGQPAAGGAGQSAQAAAAGQQAAQANGQANAAGGGQAQAGAQAQGGAQAGAAHQSGAGGQWLGGLLKWLGVGHERQLQQSLSGGQQQAADAGGAQQPAGARAGEQPANVPQPQQGAAALQQPDRAAVSAERAAMQPDPAGLLAGRQEAAAEPARMAAQETMKQALLTLASSDEVPAALRETAQQLVQHITGQQLLLSQERNGALLSHMTLFIPFQGEDGSQTASVHIQSRRGRKGELDASNCRLLFDLRMKRIGDTVVDVQVVDKIVGLSVWNDHPAIGALIEGSRDEIADALSKAGYQLLTLKTKPFPDRSSAAQADVAQADASPSETPVRLPDASAYVSKPYRGVDYRA